MKIILIPSSRWTLIERFAGLKARYRIFAHTVTNALGLFLTAVLLTGLLTGCSTAVYDVEIKSFKSSTDGAITAVKHYANEVKKIEKAKRLKKLSEFSKRGKIQVRLNKNCDEIIAGNSEAGSKCVVQIKKKSEDGNEKIFKTEKEKFDLTLFDALAQYANNLEKAASSEGSKKVVISIGELSGAVVSFVKASKVSEATKNQVEGILEPFIAIFQWATGNYLNYKRWQALKKATQRVHPVLEKAQNKLNRYAVKLHSDHASDRLKKFQSQPRIVEDSDLDKIVALEAQAREVAKLINSKPTRMFNTMVKAHRELTRAIADQTRQAETVYSALFEFKKAVDDVKKAFEKEDAK